MTVRSRVCLHENHSIDSSTVLILENPNPDTARPSPLQTDVPASTPSNLLPGLSTTTDAVLSVLDQLTEGATVVVTSIIEIRHLISLVAPGAPNGHSTAWD